MNAEILERNGILNWEYYGDSFDLATLFIGNGFSINLCSRLSYNSIYSEFKKEVPQELTEIFESFDTTNFEVVLNNLRTTKIINDKFGVDSKFTDPLVDHLKNGLIKVIGLTHPTYAEIAPDIFRSLAKEISRFKDIFTTNYDVFLYKIILAYNELIDQEFESDIKFKDNFSDEISGDKIGLYDYDDGSKVLSYLHGSLFLFHDNVTYKYRRGSKGDEYITLLRMEVANGNFPLFIAEGQARDKYTSITNNYYLRSRLEMLKRSKGPLVVYGSAFQESDQHIVNAINLSSIDIIIISIYVGSKTEKQLQDETSRFNSLFANKEVLFYDSSTLFHFHPYHKY